MEATEWSDLGIWGYPSIRTGAAGLSSGLMTCNKPGVGMVVSMGQCSEAPCRTGLAAAMARRC